MDSSSGLLEVWSSKTTPGVKGDSGTYQCVTVLKAMRLPTFVKDESTDREGSKDLALDHTNAKRSERPGSTSKGAEMEQLMDKREHQENIEF